jgi:hypothetical protein
MIVPQYWAEARLKERVRGRYAVVRRFGWSDASPEEAQHHANARAREAMDRLHSGETIKRREPRVAYNGAEGVPIREEVLERHGETVISRNGYGAHCLNTPNVLFADVDYDDGDVGAKAGCAAILALGAVAAVIAIRQQSLSWFIGALLGAALVGLVLTFAIRVIWRQLGGGPAGRARRRLLRFLLAHPEWHVRWYDTPAGCRLLAMHRTFAPDEPEVAAFFAALGTDQVYVTMCRKQHCFRARVSAKPWRIGIGTHLLPRVQAWPVRPEVLPIRQKWVADYEREAQGYAACRFVQQFGARQVDPAAEAVRRLHDDRARATTKLHLA